MKRILFITLFCLATGYYSWSQNTFEFLLEYRVHKWTQNAIEDYNGNFVILVTEGTNQAYVPTQFIQSYLLIVNPIGDTLTHHYNFGDTLFSFDNLVKIPNGYFITGVGSIVDTGEIFLLLVQLNEDFSIQWSKFHDYSEYWKILTRNIFRLDHGYILTGNVCYYPCPGDYPFFVRIDNFGNVLQDNRYHDHTGSALSYCLSTDTSQIWLFTGGSLDPINGPSLAVFDTCFNHLYSQSIGYSKWYFTSRWCNDSTFILSYIGRRPGATYQDDELYVTKYDKSINPEIINYFGTPDTSDVVALKSSIDFRNCDSIFFAGIKHNKIGWPPPGRVSWIMTGQLDEQLEPRYLHFIGGDAYYETYYIIAARDGGSLIGAGKYDHDNEVYDLLFLKLNKDGLIVGLDKPNIPIKKALLYPNPALYSIYIQTALMDATFELFNIEGKKLLSQPISGRANEIEITHLKQGVYIYVISTKEGYVETGKFVKQ